MYTFVPVQPNQHHPPEASSNQDGVENSPASAVRAIPSSGSSNNAISSTDASPSSAGIAGKQQRPVSSRKTQGKSGRPPSPTGTPRPKRVQVARACDYCRVHRIKCDDSQPCHNCLARGGQCSNSGRNDVPSLSHATREIERLRAQVKELEDKLHAQSLQLAPSISPGPSIASTSLPSSLDPLEEHRGKSKQWDGLWASSVCPSMSQFYGPASSFAFMSRLSKFIGLTLQQPIHDSSLHPNTPCRVFPSLPDLGVDTPDTASTSTDSGSGPFEFLSRAQEDYFLGLFWQTYYCFVPIINEQEFRKHYESLWTNTQFGPNRRPSPLVDIVMALCVQYGMSFLPRVRGGRSSKADVDGSDPSIAGRNYYHRCHMQLLLESENPSMVTLQCHVYAAIYLRNASFVNTAHNQLALALRIAHLLGLHQRPADDMPEDQRQLRLRVWWIIYSLESKACISLGRPWHAHMQHVSCGLPSDSTLVAQMSGSNFVSPREDATWLSYHLHSVKLYLVARAIQNAFAAKMTEMINSSEDRDFYSDAAFQETMAEFLSRSLHPLRSWIEEVPDGLKTERRGGGEPFSTGRSALDVDSFAPIWLQRQRLMLELLYHDICMSFYRPFIRFSSSPGPSTPIADGHAISCLNHAIAITGTLYHVLTEYDILNGSHDAYKYQWDAAMSIIGFLFGFPVCANAQSARRAMETVLSIFDIFGNNFAVAASAVNVMRDLIAKSDLVIERFRTGMMPAQRSSASSLSAGGIPGLSMQNASFSGRRVSEGMSLGLTQSHGNGSIQKHAPRTTSSAQHALTPAAVFTPPMMPQLNYSEPSTTTSTPSNSSMGFRFPSDLYSNFDTLRNESTNISADMWPEIIGA